MQWVGLQSKSEKKNNRQMSETVRTYHGSKRGLEGAIRADRGYPTNDFGAGFFQEILEKEVGR